MLVTSDAPGSVAGKVITKTGDFRQALAFKTDKWRELKRRWEADIVRAPNILGWREQPDDPLYDPLNLLPVGKLLGAIRNDREGKLKWELELESGSPSPVRSGHGRLRSRSITSDNLDLPERDGRYKHTGRRAEAEHRRDGHRRALDKGGRDDQGSRYSDRR